MSETAVKWALAASYVGGGVALAVLVANALPAALRRAFRVEREDELAARLIRLATLFSALFVVGTSLYLAANALPLSEAHRARADRIVLALLTAIAFGFAASAAGTVMTVYRDRVAPEGPAASLINLFRKLVQIAILIFGGVLILDQLGYKITTLVAGLGLASLGIGFALQDTVSNFFAGLFLAIDRNITVGDLVELEDGREGFVTEIGWRHTKMRLWDDTIIIVPNSRLAQEILINRSLPRPEMSVFVDCGVAYESDLAKVEKIAIEVAQQVQRATEGAVPDWEPFVLFNEFGDSNINFTVVLRVATPRAKRVIVHECIKALKRRFDEEGIEINYPVRTVYLRGTSKGEIPTSEYRPSHGSERETGA